MQLDSETIHAKATRVYRTTLSLSVHQSTLAVSTVYISNYATSETSVRVFKTSIGLDSKSHGLQCYKVLQLPTVQIKSRTNTDVIAIIQSFPFQDTKGNLCDSAAEVTIVLLSLLHLASLL
jgi:hypothetical protein